jgi:predicted ribosomally synthesized peptide with SipW-like signal peptide
MSSDNNSMELSRRKILASVGAVGAAGAGVGLGTSALFSDTEEFANNQLTAGQLNLVMDWEEHYSFPQIYDEFTDPTVEANTDLDVVRSEPSDPSDYVALPDPNPGNDREPVVWANDNDDPLEQGGSDPDSSLDLYFENTIIEAFPDEASTDPKGTFTAVTSGGEPDVMNPCGTLANVPSDLSTYNEGPIPSDGTEQNPGRTNNSDTRDSDTNEFEPLLNLTDIKPGDFGEFTFSTHICDNPGYLWLQMPGGLTEKENGVLEPEVEDDPDNDQELDSGGGSGELAENVETTLWYDDNCNNRIDGEPEPLVALAVLDTSDSQKPVLGRIRDAAQQLVDRLANDANTETYAGIITLESTGDARDALLQKLPNEDPITEASNYQNNLNVGGPIIPAEADTGGNSPLPHVLDLAREYLNDQVANNANLPDNPNKEILLLSDGAGGYGTDQGGSAAGEGRAALIEDFGNNNTVAESDYFDGQADLPAGSPATNVRYPDPSNNDGGTQAAETVLVARDIDGGVFAPGTVYEQAPGDIQPSDSLVDRPDDQDGDAAEISGDNDITVKAAVNYDTSDGNINQTARENVMMAISTGQGMANFYNLAKNSPTSIGNSVFADLNVSTGESVIFRGTLKDLAARLDPGQNGPLMLDGDRTTSGENACFASGAVHCFGLAWWVPEEIGNEIQSDSVGFDLGFVTEQCRNNDNPGQTFGFGNS